MDRAVLLRRMAPAHLAAGPVRAGHGAGRLVDELAVAAVRARIDDARRRHSLAKSQRQSWRSPPLCAHRVEARVLDLAVEARGGDAPMQSLVCAGLAMARGRCERSAVVLGVADRRSRRTVNGALSALNVQATVLDHAALRAEALARRCTVPPPRPTIAVKRRSVPISSATPVPALDRARRRSVAARGRAASARSLP